MAMVQVDLSEYDMLREAKIKAEEEVKELKETIKGLKDKSRVIIQTKYKYHTIDTGKIASELRYSDTYNILNIKNIIDRNLRTQTMEGFNGEYDSNQYIGFDDVAAKVEAHYKKDIDKVIESYEQSKKDYYDLRDKVEENVRSEYINTIEQIRKENEKNIEEYEEKINDLNIQIYKLNDQIDNLDKTKEKEITELNKIIRDSEKKITELNRIKKSFIGKLFRL